MAYTEYVTDVTKAPPSFASVAEAHLDDVYRYLLYMTANPSTAEELTSESDAFTPISGVDTAKGLWRARSRS